MPCTSLANHQKHSAAPVRAGAGAFPLGVAVLTSCPPPASARLPWPSTGVPPSGLFIVESVFICFIMKINLQKYIDMHFYTGT